MGNPINVSAQATDRTDDHRPIRADLDKWAQQIAIGQADIPATAPVAIREALIVRVSHLRRKRLTKFLASAIANDILSTTAKMED